jgi:AraC-like DNA-binding protein
VSYQERRIAPGVTLWQRTTGSESRVRILPDGCLDLLWDGARLQVAGPDLVARMHESPPGTRFTGLRFAAGWGPALLGASAEELVGRTVDLGELWPAPQARDLQRRVAVEPASTLGRWFEVHAKRRPVDPLGPQLLAITRTGMSVSAAAASTGYSPRHLQRRSLRLFGYGLRHLGRIVRLEQALCAVRRGVPLVDVATGCGYSDQAHLARDVRALTGTTVTGLLRESGG